MQKLFNADLLDIIPVERGFVYACREKSPEGEDAVAFYIYNQEIDIFEKIPVLTYINAKLGENGAVIARALGDFVTCNIINLAGNTIAASYSDGTLRIVDGNGEITGENKVEYLGNPACSPAANGMDLWFAVPDSNAIINYSVKHDRIEFRIGSPKEKAFFHPVDVSVYDNKLFICNANSYKIRTIDFNNYNVADYCIFNEPVSKYFRVKDVEYAVMRSGVYCL
ncbi:MAG: hypothetical protein IKK63_03565 [Clostridia bacterium]|nr:hypothetical protein [Clostridia bacterium]MBR3817685.1 hypothetical protein [Clostridia bacterium]